MKVLKKKRVWLLLLFPLSFLISALAKRSVFFAEEVFAKRIYKVHSIVISALTGWLPFSLAEFIVVVGPVVCLILLIRFIIHMVKDKENRFSRALLGIINVACVVAVILFVYVSDVSFSTLVMIAMFFISSPAKQLRQYPNSPKSSKIAVFLRCRS